MKKTIVIPARYASKRFPGKALALIHGVPMIVRVCMRVEELRNKLNCDIYVVTDDKRIYDVVYKAGYDCIMTHEHRTGTDRIYEFSKYINSEIYINVQGDEPLVKCSDIVKVAFVKGCNMGNVVGSMTFLEEGEMEDNTIVKVKTSNEGYLKNITRKSIKTKYRQCGIYAYTAQELKGFYYSNKEEIENIELTRFEKEIKMALIKGSHAVDNVEDLEIIEKAIQGEILEGRED